MNKKLQSLLFLILFFCFAFSLQSQNRTAILAKSTITSLNTATNTLVKNKVMVVQSVGQSSIIGTKNSNKATVQQGFLNYTKFYKINNSGNQNFEEVLEFVISPNPFIDYIKIDFSKKTENPVHIRIYDTNGKVFTYKKYPATESLTVPTKNFTLGGYLIQIVSGKNKYVKKILKVE